VNFRIGRYSPPRVYTVLVVCERAHNALLAPDFLTSALWISIEVFISLANVPINSGSGLFGGIVVAVMNDRSGHATEHCLDNVQELCAGRQWDELHLWRLMRLAVIIRVHLPNIGNQ
jgi:hypothetical protein